MKTCPQREEFATASSEVDEIEEVKDCPSELVVDNTVDKKVDISLSSASSGISVDSLSKQAIENFTEKPEFQRQYAKEYYESRPS